MMIEITQVKIQKDKVIITGTDIEQLLLADDLFETFEPRTIQYEFRKNVNDDRGIKYLYKVASSQPKCKKAKSIGDMFTLLIGLTLNLNDDFRK